MTSVQLALVRLLALLTAALALLGGGYWWGYFHGSAATDNAWTARQAKATSEAAQRQFRAWERADQAVATYTQNHQDQEIRYAELERRFQNLRRHGLLAVRVPVVDNITSRTNCQVDFPVSGADQPAVRLSLGAVRLWNGYLTGADQAAGACSAADAAAGAEATEAETAACAQDSGLTLDDAWDNHAANSLSCAQDRQRYQALIDYLTHQPGE